MGKDNIPVSVVMAAYNEGQHIERAIKSIQEQTFKDWEFIIVNDGSTDATGAICLDYQQRDPRIRVITNTTNLGLPKSLNLGIGQAKGGYIARADADDFNLPLRLERQYAYMQANPEIDILGTGAILLNKQGQKIQEIVLASEHDKIVNDAPYKTLFFHSSVFIRAGFFTKTGLYNSTYMRAQDKELWLRGLKHGCRYANLAEPLIVYNTNGYVRSWRSLIERTSSSIRMAHEYKIKNGILMAFVSLIASVLIKLHLYRPKSLRRK